MNQCTDFKFNLIFLSLLIIFFSFFEAFFQTQKIGKAKIFQTFQL